MNGLELQRFAAPLRGARGFFMLRSQGGAPLALGYYRRLPPGGKSLIPLKR